jgi:hypothetical protein
MLISLLVISLGQLALLLYIHRALRRADDGRTQRVDHQRGSASVIRAPRKGLVDSTGQSLVEAALVTPLLLLLTFAVIDFGLIFYVNLALENGVSQAVRYGITGQVMSGLSREESIKAVMRQATPTLSIADSDFEFSHRSNGAWVAGIGGPGDVERVRVTYDHQVFVLRPLFSGGLVQMRVESSMKNEDRFQ